MALERDRARVCGVWVNQEKVGLNGPGFFARDVAGKSDFLAPWEWDFQQKDTQLAIRGDIEPLELEIAAVFTTLKDYIDVQGVVRDKRGADRAITVYFGMPVEGDGWIWCDDMRSEIPATATIYMKAAMTGAGATGARSSFPLAAICKEGQKRGVALGVPMDKPRHYRLGFDARTGLFYSAFDFGLSPAATKTPSQATFHFIIYPFAASLRFRGALAQYYRFYPDFFSTRAPIQGAWLQNTDAAGIQGKEDFGFAYFHSRGNLGLTPRPGLLSFIHTDPCNVWVDMPPDVPRSYDGAVNYVQGMLSGENPDPGQAAEAIQTSGLRHVGGLYVQNKAVRSWCNGSVFAANPDPDLAGAGAKGRGELDQIKTRLEGKGVPVLMAWTPVDGGYFVETKDRGEGKQSLRLETGKEGGAGGAVQRVQVDQAKAAALTLRASVSTKGLKDNDDSSCFIAVDIVYADGSAMADQLLPVQGDSRDFEEVELTIEPEKPISSATVRLVLHDGRNAQALFDEVFLGEVGSKVNLLEDAGMEGETVAAGALAGILVDNYGSWSRSINYNQAHFPYADFPLVYDTHTHQLGILNEFSAYEFLDEASRVAREQGKLIMVGGSNVMHLADIACMESDFFPGGEWRPPHDGGCIMARAMCFQKPMCMLMNSDFEKLLRAPGAEGADAPISLEMAECYMQRALFYGIYPGFYKKDGAATPFFENPTWYDAVRPLYKKYIPLIRRLNRAGWRPITGAVASSPDVYLERYGTQDQGQVYIVARYGDKKWTGDLDGKSAEQRAPNVQATIKLNMAYVGFLGEKVVAHELLTDTPVPLTEEQSYVSYAVDLPPHGVHLVLLQPAS